MRQTAHSQIFRLSFEYSNPERAAWLMRDFLSKAIKKSKKTLTKNLFLKLKNLKVGFTDVENIAEHLIEQQDGGKQLRAEKYAIVKDLMNHKMKDVMKTLKQVTIEHRESKENLRRKTLKICIWVYLLVIGN